MKTFREFVNESGEVEIYEFNSLSYEEKLSDYTAGESKTIMSTIKKVNKKVESVMMQELIDMAKEEIARDLVLKIGGKVLCLSYSPKTKRFSQRFNEFMANKKPNEHITQIYKSKDIVKLLNSL